MYIIDRNIFVPKASLRDFLSQDIFRMIFPISSRRDALGTSTIKHNHFGLPRYAFKFHFSRDKNTYLTEKLNLLFKR